MKELSLIEKNTLANITVDKTWPFADKQLELLLIVQTVTIHIRQNLFLNLHT